MPQTVNEDSNHLGEFEQALDRLPDGYMEGNFSGQRWSATIRRSEDRCRMWLFAEQMAGTDIVSFNLYRLSDSRTLLKPCEMSSSKVIDFVQRFEVAATRQTMP